MNVFLSGSAMLGYASINQIRVRPIKTGHPEEEDMP
jgi:hypothetical protein